jgi:hypothetical protein
LYFIFEIGFHSLFAQASLELAILLPLPPSSWDYKHVCAYYLFLVEENKIKGRAIVLVVFLHLIIDVLGKFMTIQNEH